MKEQWPGTRQETQKNSKEQGEKVCNKGSKKLGKRVKKCKEELGRKICKKPSKELCKRICEKDLVRDLAMN